MPDIPARLAALVLVLVFSWAVAAKAMAWEAWARSLAGYRIPRSLARVALVLVPLVEAAIVILGVGISIKAEAASALFLLGAFSIVVIRASTLQGRRLPCGCFGGRKERDYRTFLVRNGALGLIAAVVLVDPNDAALIEMIDAPARGDILPVALLALGVALGAWVVWTVASNVRHSGT